MIEYIYRWIENIAYYLILLSVVNQVIPNNTYKKYIRVFTGFVLIWMLSYPILNIFGTDYNTEAFQEKISEIQDASKYLEEMINETK